MTCDVKEKLIFKQYLFQAMAIHLAEGKCVALEVKNSDPKVNVVCKFRALCGPRDPVCGKKRLSFMIINVKKKMLMNVLMLS